MTDSELLENAAKAMGYRVVTRWEFEGLNVDVGGGATIVKWDPRRHNSSALQLVAGLRMTLQYGGEWVACYAGSTACEQFSERITNDAEAATRRAILRAAAVIGKAMAA